ncbi:Ribonuclease P subunit p25-like protein [Nymphaea thermarum]|nr:Ribonuclease P subunit p25-like protein [Nymphaea thermarum]
MDRYQRVEKPRDETPINENEIRITTQGRVRNYITYATTLFQEKGSKEIVLKAMGRAINKTVMIAELIKRRIADLHQNTSIGSNDITDVWEPLEEGLLPLETTRHVSMITITLSKNELDTSSPGYQPPLAADQVKQLTAYDNEGGNICFQFHMKIHHKQVVEDVVVVEGVEVEVMLLEWVNIMAMEIGTWVAVDTPEEEAVVEDAISVGEDGMVVGICRQNQDIMGMVDQNHAHHKGEEMDVDGEGLVGGKGDQKGRSKRLSELCST